MKSLAISTDIGKTFKKRVVSLVGYGSYFFERTRAGSDIDLCLLLDSRSADDFEKLNQLISKQSEEIDITVHYLDEIEERGWDNFYHGTHGVFFLAHLGCAELLLGDDIFARKAALIPNDKYTESLIFQISQYIDRVQVSLIKSQTVDEYFYRKYLTRIMTDMMLLGSDISFREVNKSSTLELVDHFIKDSRIFSPETKDKLNRVIKETITAKSVSEALRAIVCDFHRQCQTALVSAHNKL